MTRSYYCTWGIEVDADSAEQAALKAEHLMQLRAESAWHVAGDNPLHPDRLVELHNVYQEARKVALDHGIVMAVGWQYDDHADDGRVLGYCPAERACPALVYEVLLTIDPKEV